MIKYYLLITLSVTLLAGMFLIQKIYQNKVGTSNSAGLIYTSIVGLAGSIIFFCVNKFTIHFNTFSILMACAMTIFSMLYTIIGFKILKAGNMAYYTLALMSGGMTLPYIFGLMFLDEPFTVLRLIGLIFILFGVILSNTGNGKINTKLILLCVAVFVLNGFTSIVSKLHQIDVTHNAVSANEFVFWTNSATAIISFVLYFILSSSNKNEQKPKLNSTIVLLIVFASALSGSSYFLQLVCAKPEALPASVLYPFITGGTIVFSTLSGIIFFKEKVSKKIILSVVICFVGTLLFL